MKTNKNHIVMGGNSVSHTSRNVRIFLMGLSLFVLPREVVKAETTIVGAGATLPYPLYSKWCDEYHKTNPAVRINYQPVGSGGGIRLFTDKTLDFGVTDSPLTDTEIARIKGNYFLLPTVLGGIVPAFNVSGIDSLNFTGDVLAGIYLGDIKVWNDRAIQELNPTAKLPSKPIVVIRRADGSGTTYCFTDYLSTVSASWQRRVGKGLSVNWPVGIGAKGNEGVSGMIRTNPYSIGYVELIFAKQNSITYGAVKNQAGRFVKADVESVTAAGNSVKMPDDFRISIVNAPGDNSYPISTFTWLLVNESNKAGVGEALKGFIDWIFVKGQSMAAPLDYAPLPSNVIAMAQKKVSLIQ
jgi:phosphate transport system substrate-binding protein